jgi:hypothetical protein
MAMTYTSQNVLELIQEREPMDPVTGMNLLNEAHLYITSQLHLVPDLTTTISLVAGQQEYSLPDGVVTIWDATYWPNGIVSPPSGNRPLKATNVDTLFEDRGPNWQLQANGEPWGYYERGGMIGFVPAPSVGSPASVQLFYTPATTLVPTSTLPTNIPSCYPWVYHVCRRQADLERDLTKRQYWEKALQEEMHYLREYIYGRVGRDRPRVSYRVKRVRGA